MLLAQYKIKLRKRKMKIAKNKTAAITIAIFLMLSMSASMMLVPTANAHTPAWSIPTFAYINVAPNPVGVGQSVAVFIWLNQVFESSAITNDYRFHNYQLTITAPDGTKTTKTFATIQDTTSSQLSYFTPDQVGTYNLTFNFPGQAINAYSHATITGGFGLPGPDQFVNDTYLPSSASTTLTVQQEPIPAAIGSSPLPTDYWTRPIYGLNTDWWTISSNWLGTGAQGYSANIGPGESMYPGDAVGSQTAHIMWTKPLQSGGVVGGNNFAVQGDTYFDGTAYVQRYGNPIILDGMLYYTEPLGETGGSSGPTDCVNLQTGQLIWSRTDVPALSFGYIYDMQTPDYHGVWPPILIASNGTIGGWNGYDGDTGNYLFSVSNIPAAGGFFSAGSPPGAVISPGVMGPEGEYLIYLMANAGTFSAPDWRLCLWNSSQLGIWGIMATGVLSGVINAMNPSCFTYNVSIPWLNTMSGTPTIIAASQNMLLCYNGTLPASPSSFSAASYAPYTYFTVNLNATKGTVGSILWMKTYDAPAGNITVVAGGADFSTGVFLESYRETMQWAGFSLTTGQKLWGPTASQTALDYYGSTGSGQLAGQIAYGKLYSGAMGGILYCYDDKTGDLLWTYGNGGSGNSTNAGFQNAYGDYPIFVQAVGNGVVYTVTTAHTVETPIYKGAKTRAINATDGTEIYTLSDYTSEFGAISFAIADGYTNFFNSYDIQIYTLGRGPSATTAEAPLVGVTTSTPVVITGKVTDISAGTTQNQQAADFPNGVPCASDASMSEWMSYVYQQQPEPTNFTGVQVQIAVLDSNGNHYSIGTTTTDASGTYSLTWTPIISGNFTVYATFEGTNGYWPSYAETHLYAGVTPTVTPTATPQANLVTTTELMTYLVAGVIAIIIAIAIVGLLILRKHP